MKAIIIYTILIVASVQLVQCIELPGTTNRYATIETALEGK